MNDNALLETIRLSIWGKGQALVDQHIYEEMKQHAIATLFMPYLLDSDLSPELLEEWKFYVLQQFSYNAQYNYEQSHLSLTVPYVILKGTSAAQYYSHPEYRTMGDIDIMTRREDYETACKQLTESGYRIVNRIYKETSLVKNNINIDLHQQFASLNNQNQVKIMDDLIIDNINPTHVLPDNINGLVILDHINQHLENGLGLRQIIDWMMFVDKCLPDEKWMDFYKMARSIGLDKLAIVCTYMCEKYLGLPHREWCSNADTTLCDKLMSYVLSCGNFGNKKVSDADISESAFSYMRTPKAWFGLLQSQGLVNWKAAGKYKLLKPFAWIYQWCRYVSKGLRRDQAVTKIKDEYLAAREKMALLDELGVKTATKGLVMFKDGKYIKK